MALLFVPTLTALILYFLQDSGKIFKLKSSFPEKPLKMSPKKPLSKEKTVVIIILVILASFIFLVSMSLYHSIENRACTCNCLNPFYSYLLFLPAAGLFAGAGVYHAFSKANSQPSKNNSREIKNTAQKTLSFFSEDEKKIFMKLIESKGKATQSALAKQTGLDKVKVSRIISSFEAKELIQKKKNGITNQIELSDELKVLLLD
ncbi:MAG TPA: hypothetical protein ENN46_01365 [Candidatus Woesearchaeota archaeon]|nr:hypothetical protein [Candidatus Woesearchaeota archaeon]